VGFWREGNRVGKSCEASVDPAEIVRRAACSGNSHFSPLSRWDGFRAGVVGRFFGLWGMGLLLFVFHIFILKVVPSPSLTVSPSLRVSFLSGWSSTPFT